MYYSLLLRKNIHYIFFIYAYGIYFIVSTRYGGTDFNGAHDFALIVHQVYYRDQSSTHVQREV